MFQGTERAKREQERVWDWVRFDSMKERIWKKDQEQDHGVRAKNGGEIVL